MADPCFLLDVLPCRASSISRGAHGASGGSRSQTRCGGASNQATSGDFPRRWNFPSHDSSSKAMKSQIGLAGGSGFLGQSLASYFEERGFEAVILTRSQSTPGMRGRHVVWDAKTMGHWVEELEGTRAVINLTGKSVNCRYNARNRQEILNSRVDSTRVLGQAIGRCTKPPQVWLNASTATVYRHTFGAPWDETGETESAAEAKDR